MGKLNQDNLNQIAAVLKYGVFDGTKRNKTIVLSVLAFVVLLGFCSFTITMASIEQVKNPEPVAEFILSIFFFTLAIAFIIFLACVLIFRNEKIRKDVKLWINDAVMVEAYSKTIDKYKFLGIVPLVKFQVDFDMEGTHYVRTTENEKRSIIDCGRPVGYFSGVSKYIDRKINILYSPEYDQVMILKD